MRRAAMLAVLAGLGTAAAPAAAQPLPAAAFDVQVTQGFGTSRLRLGLPLREAGTDRLGADLVFTLKSTGPGPMPGLGGSGTEHALQLELLRPLGAWTGFGHAGWRRGDFTAASPVRGGWFAELGAVRRLSPRLEVGGYVDARQRLAAPAVEREATAYAALEHGAWRWQLSATRSFAPTPDAAIWLGLRGRF